MYRKFVHLLQALGVYVFYYLVWLIPLSWASGCGGRLGRLIGPRLDVSGRARRNLKMVFPEKTAAEIEAIVAGMWENLGRIAFEFPHLANMSTDPLPDWLVIEGREYMDALIASGRPGIFFSAHLANWEIFAPIASYYKLPFAFIYRTANNPWIDQLYQGKRRDFAEFIPKGPRGTRRLANALREGKSLALLIDQKMNEGISVPFLGIPAMTAPALAHLALRSNLWVIPSRTERVGGCRFKVTFYPPMTLPENMDREQATFVMMGQVNAMISDWIRERPEQWFWLHRRWPDSE